MSSLRVGTFGSSKNVENVYGSWSSSEYEDESISNGVETDSLVSSGEYAWFKKLKFGSIVSSVGIAGGTGL